MIKVWYLNKGLLCVQRFYVRRLDDVNKKITVRRDPKLSPEADLDYDAENWFTHEYNAQRALGHHLMEMEIDLEFQIDNLERDLRQVRARKKANFLRWGKPE